MKGPSLLKLIAGLLLCAVSFAAEAQAPSSYRLTLISKRILDPAHETHEFEVTDINDKGQVSGWRIAGAGADGAFIWWAGEFRIVPAPNGGFFSRTKGSTRHCRATRTRGGALVRPQQCRRSGRNELQ